MCYSDMEPSVENLTEAIEGVGPISHMVTEWRQLVLIVIPWTFLDPFFQFWFI